MCSNFQAQIEIAADFLLLEVHLVHLGMHLHVAMTANILPFPHVRKVGCPTFVHHSLGVDTRSCMRLPVRADGSQGMSSLPRRLLTPLTRCASLPQARCRPSCTVSSGSDRLSAFLDRPWLLQKPDTQVHFGAASAGARWQHDPQALPLWQDVAQTCLPCDVEPTACVHS